MGFVDYISRNPVNAKEAKPVSNFDEEFVVAKTDAICKTVEIWQQKMVLELIIEVTLAELSVQQMLAVETLIRKNRKWQTWKE